MCCFFCFLFFFWSGRKAGSTFSFCKREQKEARPKRPVSILCRSPMKLLQVPAQLHSFPGISSALGSPPQTPRGEETGNKGSTERSSLGFCFFRGGGEGEGLRRPPPQTHTHPGGPGLARASTKRFRAPLASTLALAVQRTLSKSGPGRGGGGCSAKKTPARADCLFSQAWEWYLLHAAIFKYFSKTNLNPHERPSAHPQKEITQQRTTCPAL